MVDWCHHWIHFCWMSKRIDSYPKGLRTSVLAYLIFLAYLIQNQFISFFRLDSEFMCVDAIVRYDGHCDACNVSIASSIIQILIHAVLFWIIWCIESSFMVDCTVLHHFCVCLWFRWSDQLVFITSTVAATVQTKLFCLLISLSTHNNCNVYYQNNTTFRWFYCFPWLHFKLCFISFDCHWNDALIWITVQKYSEINL